jgi:hypothetical protein
MGTMGPNLPVYAEPLRLPYQSFNLFTLPLTPEQRESLLFSSPREPSVNEALRDLGDLPMRAEVERYRWASVAIGANTALIQKYQTRLTLALQRRDSCVIRLENHRAWEKLEPHLPLQVPPRRHYRATAFGLPISGTSTRHELPTLHEEPTSHASNNQSSASTPSTVRPSGGRVGGRKRKAYNAPRSGGHKPRNKKPPNDPPPPPTPLCNMCGMPGHTRLECPRNESARARCDICGKIGHFTKNCYKNKYCSYCRSWGHSGPDCLDPHRDCSVHSSCPVPRNHRYYLCSVDRSRPTWDDEGLSVDPHRSYEDDPSDPTFD